MTWQARLLTLSECCARLQCVGVLAGALKGAWMPEAAALVHPMVATGLSETLVQALQARACAAQQWRDDTLRCCVTMLNHVAELPFQLWHWKQPHFALEQL